MRRLKERLDDEVKEVRLAAEDISPGFGEKIFQIVQSVQFCECLHVTLPSCPVLSCQGERRLG